MANGPREGGGEGGGLNYTPTGLVTVIALLVVAVLNGCKAEHMRQGKSVDFITAPTLNRIMSCLTDLANASCKKKAPCTEAEGPDCAGYYKPDLPVEDYQDMLHREMGANGIPRRWVRFKCSASTGGADTDAGSERFEVIVDEEAIKNDPAERADLTLYSDYWRGIAGD